LGKGEAAEGGLTKHAWGWLQKETDVMGLCVLYLDKDCENVWVHIQHAGCTHM
jgi:hypothetical protein